MCHFQGAQAPEAQDKPYFARGFHVSKNPATFGSAQQPAAQLVSRQRCNLHEVLKLNECRGIDIDLLENLIEYILSEHVCEDFRNTSVVSPFCSTAILRY